MLVANNFLQVGNRETYDLGVTYQNISKPKISFEDRNRYHLWELPFLCEYIVNNHHQYVEASIPTIRGELKQAVWDHAEQYPELRDAAKRFFSLGEMLLLHMRNERCVLFPLITKLYREQGHSSETDQHSVSKLIGEMTIEHASAEVAMSEIRALLNNYKIEHPGLARIYGALIEFERDLLRQTFIENEVLFPAAQQLEHELS